MLISLLFNSFWWQVLTRGGWHVRELPRCLHDFLTRSTRPFSFNFARLFSTTSLGFLNIRATSSIELLPSQALRTENSSGVTMPRWTAMSGIFLTMTGMIVPLANDVDLTPSVPSNAFEPVTSYWGLMYIATVCGAGPRVHARNYACTGRAEVPC